jgi:hypothetical protein
MSEVQSRSVLYEDFDWRRKRIRLYGDASSCWSIECAFAGKPYRPLALGDVTIKGVVRVSAEIWLIHVFVHQQHEDRYDRILPRLAADLLVAAYHQLPPELEAYSQPAPIEAAVLPPNGRTRGDDSPAVSWTTWPEWDTPPASAIGMLGPGHAGPTASGTPVGDATGDKASEAHAELLDRATPDQAAAPVQGLSAENRAMAIALQWAKEGRPLRIREIAKEAKCSHSYLYRCKGLTDFIAAAEKRGGPPRGTKDRESQTMEAWSEDD